MKRLESARKFQFLHAVTITFGLFLINQPIIEQSQENFRQISLAVSQDFTAYLIE